MLCLCVHLSTSPCHCLFLFDYICLCFYLYLSLCLCLCVSVFVSPSLCLRLCVSVFVSLSLFTCYSIFFVFLSRTKVCISFEFQVEEEFRSQCSTKENSIFLEFNLIFKKVLKNSRSRLLWPLWNTREKLILLYWWLYYPNALFHWEKSFLGKRVMQKLPISDHTICLITLYVISLGSINCS